MLSQRIHRPPHQAGSVTGKYFFDCLSREQKLLGSAVLWPGGATVDGLETVTATRRRLVAAATEQVICAVLCAPNHARWGCRAIVESSLPPNPTLSLANRSHDARHSWSSFSGGGIGALHRREIHARPTAGCSATCIALRVCPSFCGTRHWPIDCNDGRVDEIGRCTRRRIRRPTTDQKQR